MIEILTDQDHKYLMQIGAMHTESIWALAQFTEAKIALFPFIPQKEIFYAIARDLQKSTSSVKHYYYVWRFYGANKIQQYAGLSYSHLSWAMKYEECYAILDWCVDNNASVDRMISEWIGSELAPKDRYESLSESIEKLMGEVRSFHIDKDIKEVWLAQLEDMHKEILRQSEMEFNLATTTRDVA